MFAQLLINGLVTGCLYALLSMGFALVYNTTRIFHIAYAALLLIVPYSFYTLTVIWKWNLLPALITSLLICVICNLGCELAVYGPLQKKHRSDNTILLSSLGIMTILINVFALIWGNEVKLFNFSIKPALIWGNLIISTIQAVQIIISGICLLVIGFIFKFTDFGLLLTAFRDDEQLYQTMGRNKARFRILIMFISGLLVGIGGLLHTFDTGIEPFAGMPIFLVAVTALIIGGVGSYIAPILGGLLLGILQSLSVGIVSSIWQNAIIFLVLILLLLFRPYGIMGEIERVV